MKEFIRLKKVRTHNLKSVDCEIPIGDLSVISGVSGSGKSSLAFDTLYAEGQRRYTESLSTYARQFLDRMERPPVGSVENIPPAVALRQSVESTNARSTVGTLSEIDDHLHLLFTHAGETKCRSCGEVIARDSPSSTLKTLLKFHLDTRWTVLSVVKVLDETQRHSTLRQLVQQGFRRFFVEGEIVDIEDSDIESFLDISPIQIVVDRIAIKKKDKKRIGEAIETAFKMGAGRIELLQKVVKTSTKSPAHLIFDRAFRCNHCDAEHIEPQPSLFSFNSSLGACPSCAGFGRMIGVDDKKIFPNPSLSILEGVVEPFRGPNQKKAQKELIDACKRLGIPIDVSYQGLANNAQRFIKEGDADYKGVRGYFARLKKDDKAASKIRVAKYRGYADCDICMGSRVHPDALNVRFKNQTIGDIWRMRIEELREWLGTIRLSKKLDRSVHIVLDEIKSRVDYLDEIGLGYLTLNRTSRSLSGGEMQRIQLTTSIGRALTDTLYVLDEPTAGLHATDSQRLLRILKELRDAGNTVVVVEHDPEIIMGADYVVEMGPLGGEEGGELVFQGTIHDFKKVKTITSLAINSPPVNVNPIVDEPITLLSIEGATEHNLDNISVDIPLQRFVAITGVSGSGKSTLMKDVLYAGYRKRAGYTGVTPGRVESISGLGNFEDIVMMDQSSLGRSSRSNPMSYTKVYDDIRKLFSEVPAAKVVGLTVGDFSFNSPGGRCEDCNGLGYITLEMHFLADINVKCETCHGRRFTHRVLDVKFHQRSIMDVFEMTVAEAVEFFKTHRKIQRKLRPLLDVGLGYIRMGQSTSTLSGGEAQRLKLATYLLAGQRSASHEDVLFIFDEPTIGLHSKDVDTLYDALRQLVSFGHSVLVIEHNIELIARADYVFDLGPGGGPHGGKIVGEGTPKWISTNFDTPTARALAVYFNS